MKTLLYSVVLSTIPLLGSAQGQTHKNSVVIAAEAVRVNDGDGQREPTVKYAVLYTRQLANSRWLIEGELNYINYYAYDRFSPFDYSFRAGRSQRITSGVSLLFTCLQTGRHAFRIGAGPSVWLQRNGMVSNLSAILNAGGQQIQHITFTRTYRHDVDMGINFRADYEFAVTPENTFGLRAGSVSNLIGGDGREALPGGTLLTAGLSLGYRF